MGIEIERKFLLKSDAWRAQVTESKRMAQGYLNDAASITQGHQNVSVRVRLEGDIAKLNMKSREAGPQRQEFEYDLPVADAKALLALCVGNLVQKTRHYIPQGALCWEIDEFEGVNAGLIVAELELPSLDTTFETPDWLGREVTDEARYYNLMLAERPYSEWEDRPNASNES